MDEIGIGDNRKREIRFRCESEVSERAYARRVDCILAWIAIRDYVWNRVKPRCSVEPWGHAIGPMLAGARRVLEIVSDYINSSLRKVFYAMRRG
jgi:hypothetical protein